MRGVKVINVKKTLHAKEQCERIVFITHLLLLLLLMLTLTPTPMPLSRSHSFAEDVGLHTVASFTREREREIMNFLQMEILWMWTSRALGLIQNLEGMTRNGLIFMQDPWWVAKEGSQHFELDLGFLFSYGHVRLKIQGLSALQIEIACFLDSSPQVDWSFAGHSNLISVKTNDFFHKLIHRHDSCEKLGNLNVHSVVTSVGDGLGFLS